MVFVEFNPSPALDTAEVKVQKMLFIGRSFADIFEDTNGCKNYCGISLGRFHQVPEEEVRKINPPYLDFAIERVKRGGSSYRLTYV